MLARRSTFDRVGHFDSSLKHTDATDWFLRAERAGVLKELLPDVLVKRRLHGTNTSVQRAHESHDEFLRLIKAKLDRARGRA